jgi:hypothetical protein
MTREQVIATTWFACRSSRRVKRLECPSIQLFAACSVRSRSCKEYTTFSACWHRISCAFGHDSSANAHRMLTEVILIHRLSSIHSPTSHADQSGAYNESFSQPSITIAADRGCKCPYTGSQDCAINQRAALRPCGGTAYLTFDPVRVSLMDTREESAQ